MSDPNRISLLFFSQDDKPEKVKKNMALNSHCQRRGLILTALTLLKGPTDKMDLVYLI